MSGKYQHSEEVKFRDRRPADGQRIAVRLAGRKTYWWAFFQAPDSVRLIGKDGQPNGSVCCVHGDTSAAGWLEVRT